MKLARKSAKQVVTDMSAEWIREHATSPGHRQGRLADQLFGLELLAVRMGWDVLARRLERWREDQYVAGNPSDSDCATSRFDKPHQPGDDLVRR